MGRIAIVDEDGETVGFFNQQTAESWDEDTRWNGNNHISCATGSQWAHETLYRTRKGAWVLHRWSQWQGTLPSYTLIDEERAARWLVTNGHEPPKALKTAVEALEM